MAALVGYLQIASVFSYNITDLSDSQPVLPAVTLRCAVLPMAECDFIYISDSPWKQISFAYPGTQLYPALLGFTDLHAGFHRIVQRVGKTENRHPLHPSRVPPQSILKNVSILLPPAGYLLASTALTRLLLQKERFVPAAAADSFAKYVRLLRLLFVPAERPLRRDGYSYRGAASGPPSGLFPAPR